MENFKFNWTYLLSFSWSKVQYGDLFGAKFINYFLVEIRFWSVEFVFHDKTNRQSLLFEFLGRVFKWFKVETRISNNFSVSAIISFKLLEIINFNEGTAPSNALHWKFFQTTSCKCYVHFVNINSGNEWSYMYVEIF